MADERLRINRTQPVVADSGVEVLRKLRAILCEVYSYEPLEVTIQFRQSTEYQAV